MKRLQGTSILWVSGALLLFVVFSAVRIGTADFLSGYVRDEIAAWSMAPPDASDLAAVSRALDLAQWISPGNPDHYADMARLDLVRSGMPGTTAAEKIELLRHGLKPIRQAIALRPASSYSWAILLRLKNELGEYDAEFRRSLERTVTLGPWEPELQLVVADVGWSAWAVLPGAEREMVRENLVRGMKRQAEAMLAIAQAHRDDCGGVGMDAGCSR
ncbi:MAG TPA: hypothetical protein VFF26_12600 [Gallionella sp.]|nr:hypothetical protein [Gallionella sp.]